MRGRLVASVIVGLVVLVAASGVFVVQYAQSIAQCSAVPATSLPSVSCSTSVSPSNVALNAVFVALAGLLAAIVMAISSGVGVRTSPAPSVALARRLESEDEVFQREKDRRKQLADMGELARAHLTTQQEKAREAAELAAAVAEAEAEATEELGPGHYDLDTGEWIEEAQQETADQVRRRVMADRLRTLARNKPEVVADVLRGWIDQPQRRA